MPHSSRVLASAGELGVPRIHFGVGTSNLLALMGEAGADVVGVDWRTPLAHAIPQVGERSVQGNLDPTLVFAPTEVMTSRAAEVIEAGKAARGHIFNLGHGVIPSTDPDQLKRLTEFVQSYPAESSAPRGCGRPRQADDSARASPYTRARATSAAARSRIAGGTWSTRRCTQQQRDRRPVAGQRAVGDHAGPLERVAVDAVVGQHGHAEPLGDHLLAHLGAVGGVRRRGQPRRRRGGGRSGA